MCAITETIDHSLRYRRLGNRRYLDAREASRHPVITMTEESTLTRVIEAWATDPKVDPNTIPFLACGVIRPE